MLNPFPDLLTFGLLAPAFIRLALGAIALSSAYSGFKKPAPFVERLSLIGVPHASNAIRVLSFLYAVSGVGLVLGFYTQIGAIIFLVLTLLALWWEKQSKEFSSRDTSYYTLLIICTLSLLFTGAGFLAFDLPL